MSACPSFVPVDARRAEGGDGAAAGGSASGGSAVGLLPQEARKFSIMTPVNSIYPDLEDLITHEREQMKHWGGGIMGFVCGNSKPGHS